jgi:hypothetical protein
MELKSSDTYRVAFQGEIIECSSWTDAMTIKRANDVLADICACDESPAELYRIAGLLGRYDLHLAAHDIMSLAAKARAIQYLTRSVGYHRPTPTRQAIPPLLRPVASTDNLPFP